MSSLLFFFFNDTATTEIYTLSLHDALPICQRRQAAQADFCGDEVYRPNGDDQGQRESDEASSRRNASGILTVESVAHRLREPLLAHRERVDAAAARLEANPRARRYVDASLRGHGHFRVDDVFVPVASAGGDVAGKRKVLE